MKDILNKIEEQIKIVADTKNILVKNLTNELTEVLSKKNTYQQYSPVFKFALREDLKNEKQFLPTRAHSTDTGYDVRAAQQDREPIIIKPFEYVKIPLGFRAMPQEGYWYKLVPRSSTFAKKHLHALYGVIDNTYESELVFAAQYIPNRTSGSSQDYYHYNENLIINYGDAIGQLIPVKIQEMDVSEVSNEELDAAYNIRQGTRGEGGFGSSDNKGNNAK